MIRGAVLAIAVLAIGLHAGTLRAETTVEFAKSQATLTVDDNWQRVATKGDKALVDAFKHSAGHILAITRAAVPNPDAWVADKKQAYADQIENGIKAKVPGYKRVEKKLVDANGVPALDIEAKRADGATIVARTLLFRTYALSLAIEVPKGGDVEVARTVVKTFAPPKQVAPPSEPAKPAKPATPSKQPG